MILHLNPLSLPSLISWNILNRIVFYSFSGCSDNRIPKCEFFHFLLLLILLKYFVFFFFFFPDHLQQKLFSMKTNPLLQMWDSFMFPLLRLNEFHRFQFSFMVISQLDVSETHQLHKFRTRTMSGLGLGHNSFGGFFSHPLYTSLLHPFIGKFFLFSHLWKGSPPLFLLL